MTGLLIALAAGSFFQANAAFEDCTVGKARQYAHLDEPMETVVEAAVEACRPQMNEVSKILTLQASSPRIWKESMESYLEWVEKHKKRLLGIVAEERAKRARDGAKSAR